MYPKCVMLTPATCWQKGEPPKDGIYIAIGRVVLILDDSGYSAPFVSEVQWHQGADWSGWVDRDRMAISSNIDARVDISFWSEHPAA